MDSGRFDQIARLLSSRGARRALMHAMATLRLAGALTTLLGFAEAGADGGGAGIGGHRQGHRNRKASRHRKERNQRQAKRRRQRQRRARNKETRCHPKSIARTCDGRCGDVTNNCGITVDCGPCTCGGCPACRICDEEANECVPDQDQIGQPCGEGQVCQANGMCACEADTCPTCTICAESGFCEACPGCCDGGQCVEACPCGHICCDGVCCDQGQFCHEGACCTPQCDAVTCGTAGPETCGAASCGACPDGEPCIDGTCQQVCVPGACQPGCFDCLASPTGTPICATFAVASCVSFCQSDDDCCPGQRCAVHASGVCGNRFVCWNLEFNC